LSLFVVPGGLEEDYSPATVSVRKASMTAPSYASIDPKLQDHLDALGFHSVGSYRIWCHKQGLDKRLAKTDEQLVDEAALSMSNSCCGCLPAGRAVGRGRVSRRLAGKKLLSLRGLLLTFVAGGIGCPIVGRPGSRDRSAVA